MRDFSGLRKAVHGYSKAANVGRHTAENSRSPAFRWSASRHRFSEPQKACGRKRYGIARSICSPPSAFTSTTSGDWAPA
jgi:hypothetical protein